MPLARPYSSKPSTRQTRHDSCGHFCHASSWGFIPAMVEGWQGSGYRTRTTFGHAVQVSTPRVHCCTFLSIRRAIWFPRFRREQNHQHFGAGTPNTSTALRRPRQSLSGGASGTPNRRWFRTNLRVSVPITCFHVISVHIEGEFMFLIRREQIHRTTGFRPTVTDATCCSFGSQTSPEDVRMGRRIDEFRLVLVSVPVAAATIARIGADTTRSFSRREGTIDTLIPVH
jgi:hypothetical protein